CVQSNVAIPASGPVSVSTQVLQRALSRYATHGGYEPSSAHDGGIVVVVLDVVTVVVDVVVVPTPRRYVQMLSVNESTSSERVDASPFTLQTLCASMLSNTSMTFATAMSRQAG